MVKICKTGKDIHLKLQFGKKTTSPGNPFILGSKVKVMSYKNSAGMGHCTHVNVDFF